MIEYAFHHASQFDIRFKNQFEKSSKTEQVKRENDHNVTGTLASLK